MTYGIFAGLALLLGVMYAENKQQREQIAALRQSIDYQLAGLRQDFEGIRQALTWIEPQLQMRDFNGSYVAACHANLQSMEDVVEAVRTGAYQSALVPFIRLTAQTPWVSPSMQPESM